MGLPVTLLGERSPLVEMALLLQSVLITVMRQFILVRSMILLVPVARAITSIKNKTLVAFCTVSSTALYARYPPRDDK